MPRTNCSHPNCTKPARAKGLCTTHYRRQLRGSTGTRAAKGEATQISIRLSRETEAQLRELAKQLSMAPAKLARDCMEMGIRELRTRREWLADVLGQKSGKP